MKALLLAPLALAFAPVAAQSAPDAVDDCGPIEGTIRVADEADATPDKARISEADARTRALAAVPGATVDHADLDEEDGFLVYEVDLMHGRSEYDVTIDAGTGEVLCTERD